MRKLYIVFIFYFLSTGCGDIGLDSLEQDSWEYYSAIITIQDSTTQLPIKSVNLKTIEYNISKTSSYAGIVWFALSFDHS